MTGLRHCWSLDGVGIVSTSAYPSTVVVTDAQQQRLSVLDIRTGAAVFQPTMLAFTVGHIGWLESPNQLLVVEKHHWQNSVVVDLMSGWVQSKRRQTPARPALEFPDALGEILDWEYDRFHDLICGVNHEHSAFFIARAGTHSGYQRFPLAPFDSFKSLRLLPEHALMLVICRDLNYPEGVAVYLWSLKQPGRHIRVAPEARCESLDDLQIKLSPDGALVLIQADGRPSLHRTSDGGWIGDINPDNNRPQWALDSAEPFWPQRFFIRRDCGHLIALFRRCVQVLDCYTGDVVAQTAPLEGRQRYEDGWLDAKGEHLILFRRLGDWSDYRGHRLDVFELPVSAPSVR